MKTITKIILLFVSLICYSIGYSQTGPAGVGTSATNKLWLKADDLTSVGAGNPVSTWMDASGSGNNATQAGVNRPTFQTNVVNTRPAVRFDGTDDYFGSVFTTSTQNSSIFTVFSANHTGGAAPDGPLWQYNAASGTSGFFPKYSNNRQYIAQTSTTWLDQPSTITQNTWYTTTGLYKTASTELWKDGTLNHSVAANSISLGAFTIGRRTVSATNYYRGDIAEIIYYNTPLNTAQHIIVNNYLAAKYGLTIANDKYAYESTHSYEVAGIGYDDASNTHTTAQSGGILTLGSASSLDVAGDYFLFGHDNGSIASWTSTEVPSADANLKRIAREWRFDMSGTLGTVSLSIDTVLLPAKSVGYEFYLLWVDADGDFSSGATSYPVTLSGGQYVATGVTIPDGGYVTISTFQPSVQLSTTSSLGLEPTSPTLTITLNYPASRIITVPYADAGTGTATAGVDYTLVGSPLSILIGATSATFGPTITNDATLELDETIDLTISTPNFGVLGTNTSYTYTINDEDNPRKIDFSAASSSGAESVTTLTLTVQINSSDVTNPTTVNYDVTGGTATGSGTDFTLASGVATIAPNTTTTTFTIDIIDDLLDEANETIIITLTSPTNANLGTNTIYTYTINDDDATPTVQFLTAASNGIEGVSPSVIYVTLSAPSGQNVTVDYSVFGGTATGGGTDYTLSAGTATIPLGSTTGSFSIVIIDDASVEAPETIDFTLSNPSSGATLGATTAHVFTLNDNDVSLGFTGPGGVGNSTYNKLWLKADDLTSVGAGNPVSTWTDASGSGNNATQAGANRPTFQTSVVNTRPAVRFDGTDDYFGSVFTTSSQNSSIFTVFSANHTGGAAPDGPLWQYDAANGTSGFFPKYSNNQQYIAQTATTWLNQASSITQNTWYTTTGLYKTNATELWKDGTLNHSVAANSISQGAFTIARRTVGATNYFRGDIAELIYYNTPLNTAQHIIVNNYLASKYGLTIANDKYAYETAHSYEVAGIGREDASNQHTAAQSAGILKASNPSSMGNGDYLLFGHDNGSIASWTTTEAPNAGVNTYRIAREWKFNKTGTVGTVALSVDTTLLPARPAGYGQYVIWVDQDGDFSSGAVAYQATLTGSVCTASGITIPNAYYVSFGVIRPSIQFTTASSSGFENAAASIQVTLDYPNTSNVTVNYTVSGTASSATDYVLANGTLTILAGQTTASITPSIINDVILESDETIVLTLSSPSTGVVLGTNTVHTYTIHDEDNSRKIDFSAASSSGLETVSTVTLTVQINTVDNTNPTTVNYAVTGGTATGSGTDFTLASGTAVITPSTTTTTFTIDIIDDLFDEANETIIISLSSPTNANVGTNNVYTYTINDDDATPTIQFLTAASNGIEGVSPSTIYVSLSAPSGQTITVDYADAGTGTATGIGTDYTFYSGTVIIPAGVTTGSFNFAIVDDASVEAPETIDFTLSNPSSGATLGAATAHVFTLNDNDVSLGFTGPGGVGNSTYNKLWLKADDLTSVGAGNPVSTWTDASGSGNNATQAGANRPTFQTNVVNTRPAVRFDGTDDYFGSVFTTSSQNSSIFTVFSANHNGTAAPDGPLWQYDAANGTSGFFPKYSNNQQYLAQTATTWLNQASSITQNTWYTTTGLYKTNATELWKDGTLNHSVAANSISQGAFTIARRTVGATNYFRGDIAELIYYNTPLNTAQHIIVNNYLAAKYGLTIANDKYAHDAFYSYDVAGIGREDASNVHLAARSGSILKASNPASMGNGDYLLFGHDNGSIASWTTTEAPNGGTNTVRIAREWKLDKTGTVGLVSLSIDTASLPSKPVGYDQYVIWVDADGDFSNGTTEYAATLINGSYVANNVTATDNYFVSFGLVRTSIQFTTTASNGLESALTPIQIIMNYAKGSNTTVNYVVTAGSATAGTDYILANGTATIIAGQTTVSITPSIINDVVLESDETFIITLSSPSSGVVLGTNTTHTFTINDDDNSRKISFATTSSNGDETSVSSVVVTVQINTVDNTNPTTVNYAVTGGTATGGGTDYTLASGTAIITPSTTTTTFTLNIVDDAINELNETVIITLSSPSNANLGVNTTYTHTINDNDAVPTVAFTSSTASGSEGTTPGAMQVSLSAPTGQNVTIDYSITGGTATGSGTDYTLASGTLTITAGSSTGNINAAIVSDAVAELTETIEVTISNPTNATLGATTVFTYSILDDDVSLGYTGPGGVGNSTYNKLWLKADDLTSVGAGNPVSTWTDASGSGNNATQAGANRPTFQTSVVNTRPAVRFDGTDDYFGSVFTTSSQNSSIFTVFSANHNGTAAPDGPLWQYDAANGTSGFFPKYSNNQQYLAQTATTWLNQASSITQNTWYTTTGLYKTNATELWKDGTLNHSVAANSISQGAFTIARRTVGATNYFRGDIAELIYYNTPLNTAQHIIVNNYLAAKYGLTIANDKYAYQGTHSYEVAGIGYEDASNFHTAAESAKILRIGSASSLNAAGDYLLFGHDNGSVASWTSTESPGAGIQRLAREWRFDESGTMGNVTVTIDMTTLPVMDAGYNGYAILIDADGDFTSGSTIKILALQSGSLYYANNVTITDGYYMAIAEIQNISNATGDFSTASSWLTGIVPGTGQSVTIVSPHVITLTGNQNIGSITVSTGATLNLGSNTLTVDGIGGTLSVSPGGTFNAGTGTVDYAAAGAQCVSGLTYNHLTLSGSGTKTLCGNTTINGNLTIGSVTLDVDLTNSYSIDIKGNWNNTGTFIARNGTINMTGTSAQTITSPIPTSFHNLTINNSYATDPQITLNNPAIVTGTLTLTDGVVLATSGNVLSMAGGSSTTIGSATSYINGTMTYDVAAAGATSINFPIGKSTSWRPAVLNVTHSDASSVTYTAEMFNTSATSLGYTLPPTINKVSGWRYWQIDRSGAANFTNATVRLYYSTTPNDDGVTDYTNLAVVKTVGTGTVWVDYSGTATANGTGSILSTAFTSFSKFTLANKLAGSNPLPIELLSFDAVLNNNKQVDVKWATATEISNDYFTVERSADGISFEEVGSVDGAGNSNSKKNYALVDASPLQGISYYRLKQTDFNGTYTYSQIASVELIDKDIPFVSLYPNPSDGDYLNLKFKNINTNESISIKVMDNLGKQVYSSSVKLSQTDVVLPIAFKQQLAMGIYTIKIISSKEPIMTSKFTVIN